ncbi:MAG TPA: archaetidylserine decarboxylase [Pseudorhodoplanes sp.]|nr:archaetidylserine decarboxylase [Pseudorhodoplanes sp.]
MTARAFIKRIMDQDGINFLLTNRIPRRLLTRLMGWFGRIENPLIRDLSIAVWVCFSDLDLSEAKKSSFSSLHDCFIRELKDGVRPIDETPSIVISPCDGIVGASGSIAEGSLLQVKGSEYALCELVNDRRLADRYRNGRYVTLRLTSSMYHRFHAPYDCRVERVMHIWGDTWNVNPPTLRRVKKLFCRNERAVIEATMPSGHELVLVPVAAILVAGIKLGFLDVALRGDDHGIRVFRCDANFVKGQEMGWFEHGSTIVMLAPGDFDICDNVREGEIVRMGQPLLRLPDCSR